ncbi:MAG: glycosyltransferase [Gammaproteobacteria bacterium]|nr:glycosyltransferase [Gammaproteobacteria bacterium]
MKSGHPLDIVIFGLSITSAWGNGHATTYRALVRALARRGHRVRFFERDMPWYADNRDLPNPRYCDVQLYSGLEQLERRFPDAARADVVILGSYVPEGKLVAEWLLPRASGLTAFYDIDTPVTMAKLERGECEYLTPALVPRFDLYLSFAGGPILQHLQKQFGARRVQPLYCSVEPRDYYPVTRAVKRCDLGYLGTYSIDRQPALERLLLEPARRWRDGAFCVAGPQYPKSIDWPANVSRVEHLPPAAHRGFYNRQRLTLNVTRADMVASGYSPSVRLFEAAACGVPIITDEWRGLADFFAPEREILVARSTHEALACLRDIDSDELQQIAERARARVLAHHTADHRAGELEAYVREAAAPQPALRPGSRRSDSTPDALTVTV